MEEGKLDLGNTKAVFEKVFNRLRFRDFWLQNDAVLIVKRIIITKVNPLRLENIKSK